MLSSAAAHPQTADRRRARAAADRLIAASRQNSVEYPRELANHIPMLLEIQYRLGATAERLGDYADIYNSCRKVPQAPPPVVRITDADWREFLGDRSRETDYRLFFQKKVLQLGGSRAIRQYLPVLAPGIGASAFHALMRLAYGVLRNDEAEIGTALGYWAAAFLPLRDEPDSQPRTADPLALALAMREIPAFRTCGAGKEALLWHWMRAVGNMDAFAPLIGRLQIGPDTLDRVARVCLALCATNIPVLEGAHAMTGAWWVRLIGPHLDDPDLLVRYFWQAVLALYPKIDMALPLSEPELDGLRALAAPSMEEIAAAAIAFDPLGDDEEHHPSVVFTAFHEYARTADPLYLVVAAKRVKLIA